MSNFHTGVKVGAGVGYGGGNRVTNYRFGALAPKTSFVARMPGSSYQVPGTNTNYVWPIKQFGDGEQDFVVNDDYSVEFPPGSWDITLRWYCRGWRNGWRGGYRTAAGDVTKLYGDTNNGGICLVEHAVTFTKATLVQFLVLATEGNFDNRKIPATDFVITVRKSGA